MMIWRYLLLALLISIVVHLFAYEFADFKQAYDWVMAGQVLLFFALMLGLYSFDIYQAGQYEWRGTLCTRQQCPKMFWFNVIMLASIAFAFFIATIVCGYMFLIS